MPAPFLHGYPPSESLADRMADLANAFTNAATILSDQYTDLNKATNGLLDGTYPWQGQGATSFSETWQLFGQYMQELQQTCQDAASALTKFANKLEDVEAEQVWNIFLMVVGGIATVISFAASIAEFGLDPFVDGFTAFIAKFTEQEGSDVINVADEITGADNQAAQDLQAVEANLANVPTLSGSGPSAPDLPDALAPTNLDAMLQGINEEETIDGQGLTTEFFQQSPDGGTGSGGLQLTSIGENYVQEMEDMGVTIIDSNDDPDTASFMVNRGAASGGVTWFNGLPGDAGPETTTVILGPEADDTAVYEEYLHVQRGAARGWIGLDPEDALVEEIEVEEEVLSKADELHTSPAKQAQLRQNIASYRQELWDNYQRTVP